jgi:hypothetical protein
MDTKLFSRTQPGGFFAVTDREYVPSGSIFWVGSTVTAASDAAGFGRNPDAPFATLKYALSSDVCTASAGDVIYLLPGHAEAITGATAATSPIMDIAGVKVVGLGSGSLIPTFTLTTAAAATLAISAANCWLENVKFVGNFLNIASTMTITAGGLTLKNLKFRDTSVILGALIQISIATGCHDITIDGLDFIGISAGLTAAATNCILAAGTYDRLTIINSRFYGFTLAAMVSLSTGIGYDITLENIRLMQYETAAGLGIACHNTSTGFVENVIGVNLSNTVKPVTGTGLAVGANVRYSNAVNAYAGLYCYTVDS